MDNQIEKLDKASPLPPDNYLQPDYKDKPFRNYTAQIDSDASRLRMIQSRDGVRHGKVLFVTAVYDQFGHMVNSIQTAASFDLTEVGYRSMLKEGLPARHTIAVPVKGNYFFRIGVHDLVSDRMGALEIPVDDIHPGN